jgi:hypothetical protein
MRKIIYVLFIFTFLQTVISCNTLKKLGLIPNEFEMATGLKSALEQGLFKGFDAFANPKQNPLMLLKLPGEMDKIENVLSTLGVKTNVTQITQKLTEAMANSVTVAKPIFLQSLKDMSLKDAAKILITDNNHAATDYFKQNATPELVKALTPIIDSSIKLDGADKEYKQIAEVYNMLPFLNKKMETNLSSFIAGRAMDIMFMYIAKEEEEIRTKYQLRKTDLLRKVFNYAEQEVKKKYNVTPQ